MSLKIALALQIKIQLINVVILMILEGTLLMNPLKTLTLEPDFSILYFFKGWFQARRNDFKIGTASQG